MKKYVQKVKAKVIFHTFFEQFICVLLFLRPSKFNDDIFMNAQLPPAVTNAAHAGTTANPAFQKPSYGSHYTSG